MTDWKKLDHLLPKGWEKYVVMLAEAGGADNEIKVITRFQKVLRLIYDQEIACIKGPPEPADEQASRILA